MRISLVIIFIGFFINVNGQIISDALNKYIDKKIHKGYKTELQLELDDVFVKANQQLSIDLNSLDTLFIIRGIDIQNREAYGRLWNNKIEIHYKDSKKRENNRIIGPNAEISNDNKNNFTANFNPLVEKIVNGDYAFLENYANDNAGISGVNWLIFRIYRINGKIKIDSHYLIDFDKIE